MAYSNPLYPDGNNPPPTPDEKNWAMLAHLTTFAVCIAPMLHIIAPLAIWLMKRDQSAFIAEHARESLNAQISYTLYGILFGLLCFILIGIPFVIALGITFIVCVIRAALAASNGKMYRYPLIFRFIS